MLQYFIGIIFPDEVETKLEQMRGEFAASMVYMPPPHITLAQRLEIKTGVELLLDRLLEVTSRWKPFPLVFEKVEYWQGLINGAYVAVRDPHPVLGLHHDVYNCIDDLLADGFADPYKIVEYVPHLTIGAYIPEDIFPKVKQRIDSMSLYFETEVNSFVLYEDGNDKAVFTFSG